MLQYITRSQAWAGNGTRCAPERDRSCCFRRTRAFTLVELLVVIAIIGILIALLLPAVQAAREAARRMQCSNNLKQMALAVLNYESQYKCFPISIAHYDEGGAVGNGLSWTVGILPFMEQQPLFDTLNLNGQAHPAGNGIFNAENHALIAKPVENYLCPSDSIKKMVKTNIWLAVPSDLPLAVISYAGVMGPHDLGNASIFGGEPDCHNYNAYGYEECTGSFWRHSHVAPVKMASFIDGTSNTIIIGEVLPDYDDFKQWALGNATFACTHAPINYSPPEPFDPWDWKNQEGFRSRHPGGAQFAWGDGHVSFFSETIDRAVYRGLSTRALGETVTQPN